MVQILILEDNEDSLRALTAMVEAESEHIEVKTAKNLARAREILEEDENFFQAFFLDISLQEKNQEDTSGIAFAEEIRALKKYAFTPIIMITSIASMELEAYRKLHCYQYITKPYQKEEITKLVHKLLLQSRKSVEASVIIKRDGINYRLLCKDIVYIQAVPRGICIILKQEKMNVSYVSIRNIKEKLPAEQFIQCHRMYLVNLDYIECADFVNGIINLKTKNTVEIGVTYKNEIRRRLSG